VHQNTRDFADDGLIPKRKVFLDHLIDITDKEQKWTNQELMEEVSVLIFGGSETTALIQSYILVMLAMHQDVQDKVYDEIVAILDGSRPPQAEDLSEMVYLERVIKETMRLFPVVPGVARQLDTDVQLGKK
jgi:cytochrome P450